MLSLGHEEITYCVIRNCHGYLHLKIWTVLKKTFLAISESALVENMQESPDVHKSEMDVTTDTYIRFLTTWTGDLYDTSFELIPGL